VPEDMPGDSERARAAKCRKARIEARELRMRSTLAKDEIRVAAKILKQEAFTSESCRSPRGSHRYPALFPEFHQKCICVQSLVVAEEMK
jgi:hypothetical protein